MSVIVSSKEKDFATLEWVPLLFRPKVVLLALYQRNSDFLKREWGKEKPITTKLHRQLPRNVFVSRYINTLNKLTCNLSGSLFIRLHFGEKN